MLKTKKIPDFDTAVLKGLKAIKEFADRIGGPYCPKVYKCRVLSQMALMPPKKKTITQGGLINLTVEETPAYKSLMLGLCCNGRNHYELCETLNKKGGGSQITESIEELEEQDLQTKYEKILLAFNQKGWNLYIQKMKERKVNPPLVRELGPVTQIKARKVYLPWPMDYPFGEPELLTGGLVRGRDLFRISLGCPEGKPRKVNYRAESHKITYPEVLRQGQILDFGRFTINKKTDIQLSLPTEIHLPIDSFLTALETLEDISELIKDGPGENYEFAADINVEEEFEDDQIVSKKFEAAEFV